MFKMVFVDVDDPGAIALADLSGAAIDLESSRTLAKYLADRLSDGRLGVEMVDAFSAAILVRYARPFMKGVRERLGSDILGELAPEQLQLHEKFMAWRNKHIAHSVNPFEENYVVAYYDETTVAETGIQSVSVQHYRVVGLGQQDLADVQALATALLAQVQRRVEAETRRVLNILRAKPLASVLAGGVKPRGSAGMESVAEARRRG